LIGLYFVVFFLTGKSPGQKGVENMTEKTETEKIETRCANCGTILSPEEVVLACEDAGVPYEGLTFFCDNYDPIFGVCSGETLWDTLYWTF
jgi:hypothetical protein